jgi:hypothetical protein
MKVTFYFDDDDNLPPVICDMDSIPRKGDYLNSFIGWARYEDGTAYDCDTFEVDSITWEMSASLKPQVLVYLKDFR